MRLLNYLLLHIIIIIAKWSWCATFLSFGLVELTNVHQVCGLLSLFSPSTLNKSLLFFNAINILYIVWIVVVFLLQYFLSFSLFFSSFFFLNFLSYLSNIVEFSIIHHKWFRLFYCIKIKWLRSGRQAIPSWQLFLP